MFSDKGFFSIWEEGHLFPESTNDLYNASDTEGQSSFSVHVLRESEIERSGKSVSLILISEPLSYPGCEWHPSRGNRKKTKGDTVGDLFASHNVTTLTDSQSIESPKGILDDSEGNSSMSASSASAAKGDALDVFSPNTRTEDRMESSSMSELRGDAYNSSANLPIGISRSLMNNSVDNAPAALT